MSLYYDAASILTTTSLQGSLKSRIYATDSNLKSKPSHVYALLSETAKYDVFLKEVIDNAGILSHEPTLTPLLTLLLVHDHFFAKGGIAASNSHPLRQSIERHKARLQSEFTKARLKKRVPTVDGLKAAILKEKGVIGRVHPRWVRVNTATTSLGALVKYTVTGYDPVGTVSEVVTAGKTTKVFRVDQHIRNLLAYPPDTDFTKHAAYLDGEIILQDKASCFPAQLLMGGDETDHDTTGDAMDGCAAPGNKTTHLAALMQNMGNTIYACERDAARSKTLQMMVNKAKVEKTVKVLAKQDFLALDPHDPRFRNVTHLLLDPSCSGSGIVGREDIPDFALPVDVRKNAATQQGTSNSKKRKRGAQLPTNLEKKKDEGDADSSTTMPLDLEVEEIPLDATKSRLEKLSNLQSRIVEHAFTFPAARRVTYSTCSIHIEENEAVVARVLASRVGTSRGWRVMKRKEQIIGIQMWPHRGIKGAGVTLSNEQREACIRCAPDDGEGTMGFFVCGFVRDVKNKDEPGLGTNLPMQNGGDEEWEGFSDT